MTLISPPHPDLEWIRESNLIEEVDDPLADDEALGAWLWFKQQPLTIKSILGMHWRLMQRLNPPIAGKIRNCNVQVGSRICPPWQKVPGLLKDWLRLWGKADSEETIQQAHVAYEEVHPFRDGNGRSGRCILQHQRTKIGLPPLLIQAAERWNYYAWFEKGRFIHRYG